MSARKTQSLISDQFLTIHIKHNATANKIGHISQDNKNLIRQPEKSLEQRLKVFAMPRQMKQAMTMVKTGRPPSWKLTGYKRYARAKIHEGSDKTKAANCAMLVRIFSNGKVA